MPAAKSQLLKVSDLELLSRLKGLSWLSSEQLKSLDDSMACRDIRHKRLIFEERGSVSPNTYILLTGTAELSHLNGVNTRIVAIMPPGVLFRMPLMPPVIDHNFQWTALNDCRVGELTTESFINVSLGILPAHFARVTETVNGHLGFLIGRYPSFLGYGLAERVAVALLQLALEFGVRNSRGILIRITITQRQLADLVGASRAKVGQVLVDFERRKIVAREGRQLAVMVRSLEEIIKAAN